MSNRVNPNIWERQDAPFGHVPSRQGRARGDAADFGRQLNKVGIEQAVARASKFDRDIGLVISSAAPRAVRTAEIVTGVPDDKIVRVLELYPAPTPGPGKVLDELFKGLGYAPVSAYLAGKDGDQVMVWAETAWNAAKVHIDEDDEHVVIFGHAVCLPAMAMVICAEKPDLVEKLAAINMGEADGFTIVFNADGEPVSVIPFDV